MSVEWAHVLVPSGGSSHGSALLSAETGPGDSSPERPTDWGLADDQADQEYLDGLFRELEDDLEVDVADTGSARRADAEEVSTDRSRASLLAAGPSARGAASRLLLVIGLILIAGGFLGTLVVQATEILLFLILGVGVAAVLCVAAGVLLLPERPAPQ